jgi:hypothetical protein
MLSVYCAYRSVREANRQAKAAEMQSNIMREQLQISMKEAKYAHLQLQQERKQFELAKHPDKGLEKELEDIAEEIKALRLELRKLAQR